MQTIQEFITKYNIDATFTEYAPDASKAKRWTKSHKHFKVSMKVGPDGRGNFACEFHCPDDKALRHADERFREKAKLSRLSSLMDCLASNCRVADDATTFEEYASEFYSDVNKEPYGEVMEMKRSFEIMERQAKLLKRFLGDEAYAELLNDVEPM